jgi:hypothetical protein
MGGLSQLPQVQGYDEERIAPWELAPPPPPPPPPPQRRNGLGIGVLM